MAKTNKATESNPIYTHEGTKAQHINPELELRRSVMACLLWENEFYESGQSISERIIQTIPLVSPEKVAAIAIESREKMKLRHMPLFIVREMARLPKHKVLVADTLSRIIQRADELAEFMAIYWKDKRQPLSAQVKRGLAEAFGKFNEYELAKYNRDNQVKLRDVLFLCHAKPKDRDQELLWKRLIADELVTPDTWEVALSGGKDKKETWERLIKERKLGALALLRNLRNMQQANVDMAVIIDGLANMKVDRVLPFRFITAARYAPTFEPYLESDLLKCVNEKPHFEGQTFILVDVSGSMDGRISDKSELMRVDAACGVAMIARELCQTARIFSFSNNLVGIPPRHGFALRDAIVTSQGHGGTYLGQAVELINKLPHDRLIVITDEQSHDALPNPIAKGYMINVASAQNGIGYGAWTHIDGWSEAVLDYITVKESSHA